jgi:hypothetical protein
VTQTTTKIAAGDYAAVVKPRSMRAGSRVQGVTLVMKVNGGGDLDLTFHFSSWRFLRQHLLVFGFASPKELDDADVRLSTGRQPFLFSSRRWEVPLINALDLNYPEP